MRETIIVNVPGEAQTKSNKLYFRRGKAYIPDNVQEWERNVSVIATEAMAGRPPFMVPVTVLVRMYRATKRKCDLGNYQKSAMDALNGIVYEDDYLICRLEMWKFYDPDNPRLEIEVFEYDGPEVPLPIVLPKDRAPKKPSAPRKEQRKKVRRRKAQSSRRKTRVARKATAI